MEQVENLLKSALGEVERILNTKTVVGEPIHIEGNTLIPLISIGFGFGGGGGSGKATKEAGEGLGTGIGGGGGIRPVAVIVINQAGVKVEPVMGRTAGVIEKVGNIIGKAMERRKEPESKS